MSERCIHELFEAQVARTPHAIALIVGDTAATATELSYRDLDRRADRLAHRLRSLGVGPELPVGVCLHRGVELLVTLLAVLKAGGAYVPLDPDYPADRLAYLLEDSAAPLVVTDRRLAEGFAAYHGVVVHADDEDTAAAEGTDTAATEGADSAAARDGRARPMAPAPANPAYAIYTSGSTGRPKGVVVPHAGVVNRLAWAQEWFPLAVGDRVLQKTPYSFDVSVPELFWPLANGATVVMARPGGHRDPRYLAQVIGEHRITTVSFVPSMLRAFLAEPVGPLPSLRRILCSGEALTADLVSAAHEHLGCDVFNLYGPTEASVESTGVRCLPGEPVTIGHAVPGTRALVLDAELRAVPDLTPGQLCLAGVQLARGYHGRPGLTADRFVPDPYAATPGERLYLTGDLVRRLPDGAIVYLGRMDQQVKIRGNRVELGEIETALSADPAVAAVAVTAPATVGGEQRLAAYLVPSVEECDLAAVRARLAGRLPDYMIPTVWITLDTLPLTSSGKIDRNALPDPGSARPALAAAYLPPRTKTEQIVAEIWETVLEFAPVGLDDGFLDLGGHSLAATRICARIRRALNCDLSVEDLLTHRTVQDLAALVDRAAARPGPVQGIPATVREAGYRHELSFAQQRLWLLDQFTPGSTDYLMLEAYRLTGPLDPEALRAALGDTIARHQALRATFGAVDGVPYQVVSEAGTPPFETVSLEGAEDSGVAAAIDRELRLPIRLDRGPLLRMTLLRVAEASHVVVLVIHHIVADDWSLDVFWQGLAAYYQARANGRGPAVLDPLAVQYPHYVAWQRSLPQRTALREQLERRRAQLAPVPPVLDLPTDFPRAELRDSVDRVVGFELPAATVREVDAVARGAGATPFMVLLAVFAAALADLSGQDDFLVGTFAGNRTSTETEPLVGLFVNTLALHMDCAGDPGFAELVARVRSASLAAYRHQEVPFDQLVSALRPPRDLTRNPLVQVAFQLLTQQPDRLALPGVSVEPVRAAQGGNVLDLLLTVRPDGDRLIGELHYRADLFTPETAQALADRLARTARAAAERPELPLSALGRG
ncbi:amino acid adenylation domain-containing protein [Kitasatospora sp. NBC_00374]|uniref:amino acid adenylation domain-containing protein n=1 Tax=Kitasatospora sp. NBC_00374 TaxID=2975964 RepID=UPI0030E2C820